MSANLYLVPVTVGQRIDLHTWRPSSFCERLRERLGYERRYFFERGDIDWLREVAEDMGRDGGDHSEAEQIIKVLEEYGAAYMEIES